MIFGHGATVCSNEGETIMATLQTSGQSSAFTARSRLKHTLHEQPAPVGPKSDAAPRQLLEDTLPAPAVSVLEGAFAGATHQRMKELDQRHLLLQAVTVYSGWYLVSVQHRAETDALVAHLVRSADQSDPATAIHEGRAMQIIMDAVGDMKIQYARQNSNGWLSGLLDRIRQFFVGAV